jgi:hypothetical protein
VGQPVHRWREQQPSPSRSLTSSRSHLKKDLLLRRLILFLSLLGTLLLGITGAVILIRNGLEGTAGELVVPLTALTFAIWGFSGVMVLWDARRAYQAYLITVPMTLPFALAPQLRFFALIGVWAMLLAWLSWRVYRQESSGLPTAR